MSPSHDPAGSGPPHPEVIPKEHNTGTGNPVDMFDGSTNFDLVGGPILLTTLMSYFRIDDSMLGISHAIQRQNTQGLKSPASAFHDFLSQAVVQISNLH